MDDVTIARALHVLSVVHWIGGVAMVTFVILPAASAGAAGSGRLALFLAVEQRFSRQVKWSVTLAGLTGFYMTHRLAAWERFLEPALWWMHAMAFVWAVFTILLFVAEPLFLHSRLQRRAEQDEDAALRLLQRGHLALLSISAAAVAAAVLGAHGMLG